MTDSIITSRQCKCVRVCVTWEGTCFPKVLGLVVQEPCITFISLIHAWKDTTSPQVHPGAAQRSGQSQENRGKVTPAEACLGNMKISHLKLQSHNIPPSPLRRGITIGSGNYMSDYKIRPNVGMKATHQASLCSVRMGDDSWLDIYVNIYCFGESFPRSNCTSAALTKQLLVETGSLALYCHAELQISACLPSLLQRKLIFCLAIWWSLPQADVFRSERVAWIICTLVLQGKDEDQGYRANCG